MSIPSYIFPITVPCRAAFVHNKTISLFAFFNGDMPSLLNTLTIQDGGASVTGAFIGVVIAATIMIVPFGGFTVSVTAAVVNTICIVTGIAAALALDNFNQKFDVE